MKYRLVALLSLLIGCGLPSYASSRIVAQDLAHSVVDPIPAAEDEWTLMQPNSFDVDQIYAVVDSFLVGCHQASKHRPLLYPIIGMKNPVELDGKLASNALAVFLSSEEAAGYCRRFHQRPSPASPDPVQVWRSTRVLLAPTGTAHVYLETFIPDSYSFLELTFRRSSVWELIGVEMLINAP